MSAAPLSAAPLRVAVLGSGPRGIVNAELLASSGVGSVVGFWDRTPSRAAEAAARFGAVSAESAERLVSQTRPDVVAILTHPSARSSLVAAAVAGGARTIVIEKPLALSAEELGRVEDAAGDAFVVINTQYQWMPHWQQALALVRAGELGDILSIAGSCGVNVLEQGPHVLGLCLAVARAAGLPEPSWVLAGGSGSVAFDDLEVPADLVATYGLGDVRLTFAAGDVAPVVPGESIIHFQQQERVIGTRGALWISLNQGGELTRSAVSADSERSNGSEGSEGSEGSNGSNGSNGLIGAGLTVETISTQWPRDDTLAQSAFYRDLAAAIDDPSLRAVFPTRLSVAAAETRMLFATIESAQAGRRVRLSA